MKIQIVAIGDELLNGQVINTNAAWLADRFSALGYYVGRMIVIPDELAEIEAIIDQSLKEYEITIVTGGLGPTKDDMTKKALAHYFNCGFKIDVATRQRVEDRFKSRGLSLLEVNMLQAEVPEVATVLRNDHGTAPGILFEKNNHLLLSLPGVPYEMKGIMNDVGFPYLTDYFKKEEYYSRSILTTDIGESFLADIIGDWENRLRDEGFELAYLPSIGQVRLRLTSKSKDTRNIVKIENYIEELKGLIPTYFFGYEGQTLSGVVGDLLKEKGLSIATMESCTGGGIVNELIKTSGSSAYVKGGLITYTNEMKITIGGISNETIKKYTELSEECAKEMAENAAKLLTADLGVGITGLLESENGETFAYIAIHYKGKTHIKSKKFGKKREHNIQLSIFATLNFLRNILVEE